MWNFLYQMASPKTFYFKTGRWLNPILLISFLFLTIGCLWGLLFSPADYQQGDAVRILYIHVPAAFLSLGLYAWMGFLAVLLLIWRIKIAGLLLGMAAEVGCIMTFIALATGSIWGKPMWGAWWVWDARLTSELILLFLYFGILVTKNSFRNHEQSDKIAAILTLVGLIDLPIIHYSVYWWNTLHQGSTFLVLSKPTIALSMLYPLLFTLIGFTGYCIWCVLYKARNELLRRECRQQWIKELIESNYA